MSLQPPIELTTVGAKVEARLDRLFCEQRDYWRAIDPRLAEPVDELAVIAAGGGKRLRAAFAYWAWHGRRYQDHSPAQDPRSETAADRVAIDVGAAFELLQAFALIHDDVMDDSDTRRGRPTVHTAQARRLTEEGWLGEPRRFGEGVAILVGDLSHAYADGLLANAGPAARQIWDDLRVELNLGQYLDLRAAAAQQLDQGTAEQVSTFKSALYTIVRPLQLGASIDGTAPPELLALLERYGRPLGRAFQLKDDLLGVLGDEAAIGKPVGDDLREGKPTELAALAADRADAGQRRILAGIGRRDLGPDDVAAIVAVFEATGAVDGINELVSTLVAEATAVVADLPFGNRARGALAALAGYVAARNS